LLRDAAHLGDAARFILNRIHAIFQLLELLALLFVLHAQALILALDSQVRGFAEYAVDAVERGADRDASEYGGEFQPTFVDGDAPDLGAGTRGMSGDESV